VSLVAPAYPAFGQGRLTVFVYDYSHSRPELIRAAEDRASTVISQTGVFVDWRNCSFPDDCQGGLKPIDVVLTLESKPRRGLPQGALGQSLLTGDDSYSAYARIFVAPILGRAETASVPPDYLLGYTMIHEIAHLVLGPEHAPWGLMRKRWGPDEEARIRNGSLRFSKDESTALRLGMSERIASARGATSLAGLK